jgi:hypothetical protein
MAYDPTTGSDTGGGLLGNALSNPLFNFGVGLLSQTGPSLTPQSPFRSIGLGLQYASQAQQEAEKNRLIRAKLAESAQQQAAQAKLENLAKTGALDNVVPGVKGDVLGSILAADPSAASRLIPQAIDPATQVALAKMQFDIANTQAATEKTQQETTAATGETLGTTTKAFEDITNIGGASERLSKSNSIVQPGGILSGKPLEMYVGGLMAAKTAGMDVDKQLSDATDALTIEKATASLTTQIQSQIPSMRSNANLQNIQTAMATKMPWPTKRRVLVTSLDGVFADLKAQGLESKLPGWDKMQKLRDTWQAQDEAYTKSGGKYDALPTAGVQNGQTVPQPPSSTTIDQQPGVPARTPLSIGGALDAAGNAIAPYVPNFGQPAGATPAAPPVAPKPTVPLNAQGMPNFMRWADAKRAEKNGLLKGFTSITVDGKTYDWVP